MNVERCILDIYRYKYIYTSTSMCKERPEWCGGADVRVAKGAMWDNIAQGGLIIS